ncbi:coatomer subunit alpha, putative [Theileria equi strain WA]|uniref:Coatomer subunit alpha, putative n=1 Tax=Theileria equi strain WA TaxID=1537102 RepID=L0AUX2_THEEQ|nr:coatomer subunit alpha, putative [Theileria equi strain WA]AFZ79038.1 coatomer subunit alpha, putative [Theileria equi strain WA]|eukprot:XP_004828704.1 coatomer subunit alpha, putative [Theileria equi strain WA]
MLIKCKTKGTRVKGLAFHPHLHFLLVSLHSGEIQLWDYLNSSLVDVFKDHDGPVRAVDFHIVQPLFVSGGDDTTIIVWDFTQRKKLFTLLGHLDYIRTVQFHERYPWIISSSDDQTARIWNWQSRSCLSVLTGHNHYVMSAQFHPKKDLVITASLDHTARIWDVSCLSEKTCSIQNVQSINNGDKLLSSFQMLHEGSKSGINFRDGSGSIELMGISDVICKHILTGHSKGVNWAIFNEDAPIVITASDDKTIRAWRYTSDTVWQTNILRGHQNNVCSLIMHPNNIKYLLSVSEDHSIRVWDSSKWSLTHTFLMDNDRFWIVSKPRSSNYIAAGHDSGFIVFKLFRERPIVTIVGDDLYYVWNDVIYIQNVDKECSDYENELKLPEDVKPAYADKSGTHRPIVDASDLHDDITPDGSFPNSNYHSLDNSDMAVDTPTDNLAFPSPSGDYCKSRSVVAYVMGSADIESLSERFLNNLLGNSKSIPKSAIIPKVLHYNIYNTERVCLLLVYSNKTHKSFEILIKTPIIGTLDYKMSSQIRAGLSACFSSKNTFVAVDTEFKASVCAITGELSHKVDISSPIDMVFPISTNIVLFWSHKENKLMIYNSLENSVVVEATSPYGKLKLVIVSKSRQLIATVYRNFVIIYDRNLKRIAIVESYSKIKSAAWDENTSVIFSTSTQLHYLLVNGNTGIIQSVPNPIYLLRIANKIMYIMGRNHRCYRLKIQSNDYAFKCAVYSNNLDVANKLIDSMQLSGKFIISYLIDNGHASMARKIIKDNKSRFEIALKFGILDDAVEDAQALDTPETWKQLGDAALSQGNCSIAEFAYQKGKVFDKLSLLYLITGNTSKLKKMMNISKFRKDSSSVLRHTLYLGDMEEFANTLKESGYTKLSEACQKTYGLASGDGHSNTNAKYLTPPQPIVKYDENSINWPIRIKIGKNKNVDYDQIVDKFDGLDLVQYEPVIHSKSARPEDNVWDSIDDNELDLHEKNNQSSDVDLVELVMEGKFIGVIELLTKIFGDVDSEVLKVVLSYIHNTSVSNSVDPFQQLNDFNFGTKKSFGMENIADMIQEGFKNVTAGNFEESLASFRQTLQCGILMVLKYPTEMKVYVDQCRIYILAMILELERERLSNIDPRRSLELAAYFTCCDMQPRHRYLALRRTIGLMWKAQNYISASALVKRLLSEDITGIEGAKEEMTKAKRIQTLCEQKGTEAYRLDFDAGDKDLVLCTLSFTKIKSSSIVQCKYCKSIALEKFYGEICNICQICTLT